VGVEIVRQGLEAVIDSAAAAAPAGSKELLNGVPPVSILCPHETHGKIKTADRVEIEGYAAIRRMIEKYQRTKEWSHPLCIAVFGPPGSGKNFTVKQIVKTVDRKLAEWPLEFNMAQFKNIDDLKTAFHQAQDRALGGEIPLVVFDEFDCATEGATSGLGWLKYFLAPMQDGKFKAGESMYRIGRAIFVFAGGTFDTFEEFKTFVTKDENKKLKGPDFVSRLRGHLVPARAGLEITIGGQDGVNHPRRLGTN
jgi:hypothetical protein